MAYIYKIINDVNNKMYIGKTERTIEERFKEHCNKGLCCPADSTRPLYKAMRKYGIDHFHVELIEETNEPEEREKYWIEFYNTFHSGYNVTVGGDGKHYLDYDLIIKTYNQTQCKTDVAKILNIDIGTVSKVLKSYHIETLDCTDVIKQRYGKPVALKENKQVIKTFPSLADAARYIIEKKLTSQTDVYKVSMNIGRCAAGKRKSAFGYQWELI